MVWGTGKAATEFANMPLELFCQCPGLSVLLAKESDGFLSITFQFGHVD
jgi:hypothetical protein